MTETNAQGSKKSNGIFIVIILLLLGGMGYMGYLLSQSKKQLTACSNEVKTLNTDMNGMNDMLSGYVGDMSNDLKSDFKNMLNTYDALLQKDQSQSDSLLAQKAKIEELLGQVERGRLTARQLSAMKKENETLRNIMKGYVVQIDSLNTLNLQLTSDLDASNTALQSTTAERDDYKEQAEKSAQQVKEGSKLQAYGFSSGALKKKLNGSMGETTKARSARQLKAGFTLSENPITTAGMKWVYMQIITPEGKTLQKRSTNFVETGAGQVPYSDKKQVDYQNQRLDMTIYYDINDQVISKGNYKVKIYCQGDLIGSDSFTLK